MSRSGPEAVFRGRPASFREGVRAARGVPAGRGGGRLRNGERFGPRPTGRQIVCVFPLRDGIACNRAGKRGRGAAPPESGLQAGPEKSREHHVEMKVWPSLRTGLAIVEAQVLLGIAEGKLDWEAGAMEAKDAFRRQIQVGAVQEHTLLRFRVGTAGQDMDHLQPACQGLGMLAAVVQVDLLLLQGGAGHACRVAAVEATVELALAAGASLVGAEVGEAQDRILAQPPHRVQVQLAHALHKGAAA